MGLGFVLLFWGVVGTVLAVIGTAALAYGAGRLTRGAKSGARRRVIIAAGLFPFACFAWSGGVFVFQAVVNETLLHRDVGMGDTWHAPLPNGDQVMMIDITDQGVVYNPKTQASESGIVEQEDTVWGVREMQVAGRYVLAGADTRTAEHLDQDSNQVDCYFLLDTQTGKRTPFKTYDELRQRASELNIQVNMQPIYNVYAKYRFSSFDVFAGLMFCVPPIVGLFVLIRQIVRLRRARPLLPQTP